MEILLIIISSNPYKDEKNISVTQPTDRLPVYAGSNL